MQACARIGATHSVVFGGFSAKSLHERIIDAGAVAVITADEQVRGGKELPLKAIVDEALGDGRLRGVRNVDRLQAHRRSGGVAAPRDVWMHELVAKQPDTCEPEWVDAEHPLFILYTSGSTGKPKGVQHSSGRLPAVGDADDALGVRHQARPTSSGAPPTSAGSPATRTSRTVRWRSARPRSCSRACRRIPNAGRFWQTITKHKVSIFYTAPTAIRSLIKACDANPQTAPKNYDLSSLRLLGTVGEPINPGGVDVVSRERRRRALPDRRHVVADRDGRPHDHAAAGRDAAGSRIVHAAAAGHHGRDRRRDRPRRRQRARRHPRHQAAVAGDDPHDLGRPGALQEVLLPRGARRQALSRGRRLGARQGDRLLHDHGPHRRRAQRVRAIAWARWKSNRRWSPIRSWRRPRSSAVPTT